MTADQKLLRRHCVLLPGMNRKVISAVQVLCAEIDLDSRTPDKLSSRAGAAVCCAAITSDLSRD